MEKLTALFDKLELSKLVPQMDKLLHTLRVVVTLAILIGPVVLMVMGLRYLFLPPAEANRRAGFRTYFGMGSVEAWHLTQKIAGIALSVSGLILGIIMLVISRRYSGMDLMAISVSAIECLLWQAGVALTLYFGISVTAAVLFDAKGNRRQKK